jgi:hypothetical protein
MLENNTNLSTQKGSVQIETEPSLKGTLLFVMFVGLFIVVSWFGIFFLFLSRL